MDVKSRAQPGTASKTTELEYGRGWWNSCVAVKCVDIGRNTSGEATTWTDTDTEVRKRGANRIRYLVVHAVNDVD